MEFSYSAEWIEALRERSPQVGTLLEYYRSALLNGDWGMVKRCESSFLRIGQHLRADLGEMLKLEAIEDGVLSYWFAVLEYHEGHVASALHWMEAAQTAGPASLTECI